MMQELRREVAILQRVSADANVVQFYGAVLPDGRASSATALPAMLVMEYLAVSRAECAIPSRMLRMSGRAAKDPDGLY
jgi:hypothetical protein